jgi:lactate dehydrogenase-like 2-hydroxyacid dehydrogenase
MDDGRPKVFAYSIRPDEKVFFSSFCSAKGIELGSSESAPSMDTITLAAGYPCVSIITTIIDPGMVRAFREAGVRFISTRTIGYDHIDLAAVRTLGMRVGNAPYSPDSVADYTIMLMLMATRRMKAILRKKAVQDFSLVGSQGVELRNLRVGIAGTGRIGRRIVKKLSTFGCEILAHDLYPSDELKGLARYVSWEELARSSDLISLHMPATEANYHLVNKASLATMKDGVFIINTARGSLIDTAAFIEAVESGKVGGACLDVIEDEAELYYNDLRGRPLKTRDLALLDAFPNVLVTPHTAFYTDQAVRDMVENSLRSCVAFQRGEDNPWEVRLC